MNDSSLVAYPLYRESPPPLIPEVHPYHGARTDDRPAKLIRPVRESSPRVVPVLLFFQSSGGSFLAPRGFSGIAGTSALEPLHHPFSTPSLPAISPPSWSTYRRPSSRRSCLLENTGKKCDLRFGCDLSPLDPRRCSSLSAPLFLSLSAPHLFSFRFGNFFVGLSSWVP